MKKRRQRLLALVLSLLLLAGMSVPAAAGEESWVNPFHDVAEGDWFYAGAEFCCRNGLIKGVTSTTFAPNLPLSRAMLATILWRYEGSPDAEYNFALSDLKKSEWYATAALWANRTGVITGVPVQSFYYKQVQFQGDRPATREEVVCMLVRYAKLRGIPLGTEPAAEAFPDEGEVSAWAAEEFSCAVSNGLIKGRKSGAVTLLAPKEMVTRAEAALILRRMDALLPETDTISLTANLAPTREIEAGTLDDATADKLANFEVALFQKANTAGENTVLSPLSALYALGMLNNGASGNTKAQLAQAIGMDTNELNQALATITASQRDGKSTIKVANSLWIRDAFPVNAAFLQDTTDWYQSEVFHAPFTADTAKEINRWVNRNTDGLIPSVLKETPIAEDLCLINTLLYKGLWAEPYSGSSMHPFTCENGEVQTAQMLHSSERYYLNDGKATGFRKSLSGDRYDFAVLMPNEGISVDEYIAGLTGVQLRETLAGEAYDRVYATMPKFEISGSTRLVEPLKALGITDAFQQDTADFSAISDGLYVTDVFQKAKFSLDENGVSAAAATLVITAAESVQEKIVTVTIDRPYVYLLIDTQTNLPLFLGTVRTVA